MSKEKEEQGQSEEEKGKKMPPPFSAGAYENITGEEWEED